MPSGSYSIWCNEATDYPNMCVEVPSESWVDPCYQGQMMPGGDVIGWDDWDVEQLKECFATYPKRKRLSWRNIKLRELGLINERRRV